MKARPLPPRGQTKQRHRPPFYPITRRRVMRMSQLPVRPPLWISRDPSPPGAIYHPSFTMWTSISVALEQAPNRTRRPCTPPNATATSHWPPAALLQRAPWLTFSAFALDVSGMHRFLRALDQLLHAMPLMTRMPLVLMTLLGSRAPKNFLRWSTSPRQGWPVGGEFLCVHASNLIRVCKSSDACMLHFAASQWILPRAKGRDTARAAALRPLYKCPFLVSRGYTLGSIKPEP